MNILYCLESWYTLLFVPIEERFQRPWSHAVFLSDCGKRCSFFQLHHCCVSFFDTRFWLWHKLVLLCPTFGVQFKIASLGTADATTNAYRHDTCAEWISREVITVILSKTGNEKDGQVACLSAMRFPVKPGMTAWTDCRRLLAAKSPLDYFAISLASVPTPVGCSLSNVRWTIWLTAHDQINRWGEAAISKWSLAMPISIRV